jgi:hypothetical protein
LVNKVLTFVFILRTPHFGLSPFTFQRAKAKGLEEHSPWRGGNLRARVAAASGMATPNMNKFSHERQPEFMPSPSFRQD